MAQVLPFPGRRTATEVLVELAHKGLVVRSVHPLDVVVGDPLAVEVKGVSRILLIDGAWILTCLSVANLLLNLQVQLLKDGVIRLTMVRCSPCASVVIIRLPADVRPSAGRAADRRER